MLYPCLVTLHVVFSYFTSAQHVIVPEEMIAEMDYSGLDINNDAQY